MSSPISARLQQIEAARYAVLQRLAPAIRHGIVGKLHPVGLVAEALARRLQAQGDLAQAGEGARRVHELARSAISGSADLLSWLGVDVQGSIALGAGIAECLALLETDAGLRGHAFVVQGELEGQVDRLALRHSLPAALLAWQDELAGPSDLMIEAREGPEGMAMLVLAATPAGRPSPGEGERTVRPLQFAEAALLAEDAGAELRREARGMVLQLPLAGAPSG